LFYLATKPQVEQVELYEPVSLPNLEFCSPNAGTEHKIKLNVKVNVLDEKRFTVSIFSLNSALRCLFSADNLSICVE
jgi:hypothetical protein